MSLFVELSLILVVATLIALIMRVLKQPLIVGYIIAGILVGPFALNLLHSQAEMELFSKLGISILLFIVGLTINPDIVKEVGKTSFITALGQIFFTSIVGFLLVYFLGFNLSASIYIAIALTLSSTIIVLKLLTDRGDTGKLYGKISIGFLLVQDLVAIIVLLGITAVSSVMNSGETNTTWAIGKELFKLFAYGGLLTLALYFISKYILPKLVSFVGGNQEILFVFSISWGLGMASLFYLLGFSVEIGALIAGVMLAVSPFAYEIGAKMKPLRDFFILIFFILLGSQMILSQFFVILVPAIILSLFVLIGNPLIVFLIMNILRYRTRTAFMAGLTVAQVSEFSLILVALGYSLGQINEEVVSLVTLIAIVTIAGSTYLILYADWIYSKLHGFLKFISIYKYSHYEPLTDDDNPEIIIFGYDRVGYEFVSVANKISSRYLVVDYNPRSIKSLKKEKIPFRYGDAEDLEFLQEIGFSNSRLIISTIPEHRTNLLLVKYYRKRNTFGTIIVIASRVSDAKELYACGASYVVMPHHLGAHHAAQMITKYGFNTKGFAEEREIHLAKLLTKHHLF